MDEKTLIAAAKGGDRDSFAQLIAPHLDTLRAVVHRMIGHPDDAADLIQEAQLKAFTKIDSFREESGFGTWLIAIATRGCLDHLRKEARWRPHAQVYAEQDCLASAELRQTVDDTVSHPEFTYDVREHIAFCFTCVARSIPPMQEAALILREVVRFSNREAAKILDITESVLRHHLADGRKAMKETYDGLCALVNKQGVCHQCSGLRNATPEAQRGPEVESFRPEDAELAEGEQVTPDEARFRVRLRVVREHSFTGGVSDSLHEFIFNRVRHLEQRAALARAT